MKYLSVVLCLILLSCHKGAPVIFWGEFDPLHIDKVLSEKGPLDGYRVIFWQSNKGAYKPGNIDLFLADKGWKYAGMEKADTGEMKFIHKNFGLIADDVGGKRKRVWPSWFKDSCMVYEFVPVGTAVKSISLKTPMHHIFANPDASKLCVYDWEW